MADEIVLDEVSRDDLAAIHRIEDASFPAPWRIEFFSSELEQPGRFLRVARRDGEIVGYLFCMWFFDEMHVNKIAVAENERRKGIAELLMADCLTFARAQRIATITLEVRRSNHGAQAFYKTLGFESRYVRSRYYPDGEAAIVMQLALDVKPEPDAPV